MATYSVKDTSLTAVADAIRAKTGSEDKMTLEEMAAKVEGIAPPPPEEAFVITGNCAYKFQDGGWDWFLETYGDRITAKDISDARYMFKGSKVKKIPFIINFKNGDFDNTFSQSYNLEEPPRIAGTLDEIDSPFSQDYKITSIPEDYLDSVDLTTIRTDTSG